MIGSKRRVGRAARKRDCPSAPVDDELGLSVAAQYAAHESDIMEKAGDDEVSVVRGLDPVREAASSQDIAADDGHEHGMLEGVVEGVAPADVLDRDLRQRSQTLGQIVLGGAKNFAEILDQQPAELFGRHGRNRIHQPGLP